MAGGPQLGQRGFKAVGGKSLDRGVRAYGAWSLRVEPSDAPGRQLDDGGGVAHLPLPPRRQLRPGRGESLLDASCVGLGQRQSVLLRHLDQATKTLAVEGAEVDGLTEGTLLRGDVLRGLSEDG